MNLHLRKPLAIICLMTPLWVWANPPSEVNRQDLQLADTGLTHIDPLSADLQPMTDAHALIPTAVAIPGGAPTLTLTPLADVATLDATCSGYACLQALQPDTELGTLSQRAGLNHDALNSTGNFRIVKLEDPENLPIEFHNSWQSLLSKYPFLILSSVSPSSTPQGISYYYGALTAISATLFFILIWRWRWKTTTNTSPHRV